MRLAPIARWLQGNALPGSLTPAPQTDLVRLLHWGIAGSRSRATRRPSEAPIAQLQEVLNRVDLKLKPI
ncbi:hypothetical protein V496_01376 [Pseudogymnoascus sp. VKM F-4515 (FW-2607)]|nr:hypothetical protein V496_01376 [Pseudogymnoascus sp. VKM F-4515 (FW-2607)]